MTSMQTKMSEKRNLFFCHFLSYPIIILYICTTQINLSI